jgi:hypothetical protein
MWVPTDEFYVYLQGYKGISEALKSVPAEEGVDPTVASCSAIWTQTPYLQ